MVGRGGASTPRGTGGMSPAKIIALAAIASICIIVVCVALSLFATAEHDSATSSASNGSADASFVADKKDGSGVTHNSMISSIADPDLRLALQQQVDSDGDNELSKDEIAAATTLDLSGSSVATLDGLAILTSLKSLDVSNCAQLSVADLSKFSELESFAGQGSGLERVNVASNGRLSAFEVDDSVDIFGLEDTQLQEAWRLIGYSQKGYGGYDDENEGDWSVEYGYDDENRLVTAEISSAHPMTRKFFYDEEGRLNLVEEYSPQGAAMGEIRFDYTPVTISAERYTASGEFQERHYVQLDASGRPIRMDLNDDAFTAEYQYDSSGNLALVRYTDPNSTYANFFSYTDGRLVEEKDTPSEVARNRQYEYDSQGRCVKRMIMAPSDNRVIRYDDFTYDGEGRIQCDGLSVEYDKHGNIVKRVFSGDNEGVSYIRYQRMFLPKGGSLPFQPLCFDDPASAPVELLPCTINTMDGQDPIARHHGPYVLRKL